MEKFSHSIELAWLRSPALSSEFSPARTGFSSRNKIEHRVICHITRNWRGVPLETHEVVVSSIGDTRTASGLEVHAWLDESTYEKGVKVSDEALSKCAIKRHDFHSEWNYEIHPRKPQNPVSNSRAVP